MSITIESLSESVDHQTIRAMSHPWLSTEVRMVLDTYADCLEEADMGHLTDLGIGTYLRLVTRLIGQADDSKTIARIDVPAPLRVALMGFGDALSTERSRRRTAEKKD